MNKKQKIIFTLLSKKIDENLIFLNQECKDQLKIEILKKDIFYYFLKKTSYQKFLKNFCISKNHTNLSFNNFQENLNLLIDFESYNYFLNLLNQEVKK